MNDLDVEGLILGAVFIGGWFLIGGRVPAGIAAVLIALLLAYARIKRAQPTQGPI